MSQKNHKHTHNPTNIVHNKREANEAMCSICGKRIKESKSKGGRKSWFIEKRGNR
jgi:hypothetical protein